MTATLAETLLVQIPRLIDHPITTDDHRDHRRPSRHLWASLHHPAIHQGPHCPTWDSRADACDHRPVTGSHRPNCPELDN